MHTINKFKARNTKSEIRRNFQMMNHQNSIDSLLGGMIRDLSIQYSFEDSIFDILNLKKGVFIYDGH